MRMKIEAYILPGRPKVCRTIASWAILKGLGGLGRA